MENEELIKEILRKLEEIQVDIEEIKAQKYITYPNFLLEKGKKA